MEDQGKPSAINRGRLRWLASRHALLELDIVFRKFLDEHFDRLDEAELATLDELLALDDHDLWEMISGRRECAEARWKELVGLLRAG